ncbi:hypothetical protein [Streptomyces griseorubiginosus]|uniref:hypothetical protein n=1 Tax=Streptomyces griseorubiginosus TaxID=67304 RepID=UPI00332794EC
MSEIADFLRARYTEARERETSTWAVRRHLPFEWTHVYEWNEEYYEVGDFKQRMSVEDFQTAYGEAAPDAAVLADLDAKLALVDELDAPDGPVLAEAQLHARFAHPAWEYGVTEGPRKQWDDIDVPPCDDNGNPEPGWERNVDAGRNGWERWDYTEESYWRRLRPNGARPQHIPRGLRILAQPFSGHPDHKGEEWGP